MARGTPSSLFTSHPLLKGVFFSFILALCISGFICSVVRENKVTLSLDYGSELESVRHLALATLILGCLSFGLALVALGCFAAVPILRHMKGNWRDGCILLAIGTLLLWVVSIILAGVQRINRSDGLPSQRVGIASGVLLLLAGLSLALTFACIYFGLRRVKTQEGQELQGLDQQSAMPHTGGRIKDLYSEEEPAADAHSSRTKPTRGSGDAQSGDAFSWQQQSNSQSDTWQQTSGSQHNSWQQQNDTWQQNNAKGGAHPRASAPPAPPPAPYGVTVLSLGEVYAATDGFSANNFLGQGGFGQVYRGVLPNAKTVAVKRLQLHLPGSARETVPGERDFQAEATIIARVHHRHLVQLVGFCTTAQERILVLEYMPNGSLADNLYGDKATPLTWPQRLSIAIGAAKGLAYLHEDCQPRIIHRDIKASNILLDAGFVAKIADFGFARFAREFQSMTTATRTVGTFHYLPPECTMYGEKNTDKSDVYSFGVVLLEILSGRPPVDPSQPRERVALIPWARQLKQTGNERFIVDERLGKGYASHEVARVFECAIACLDERPEMRPSMGVVLRMLEGHVAEPPQPPPVDRQHSTIYGRDTDVSMVIPITIHEGR